MSDGNPLLNNVSVQGAAKSIEGLMDSKGVIKKMPTIDEKLRR